MVGAAMPTLERSSQAQKKPSMSSGISRQATRLMVSFSIGSTPRAVASIAAMVVFSLLRIVIFSAGLSIGWFAGYRGFPTILRMR